ncbi:restriction endonuclease subunit S [Streptomyces sp. NPDC001812]|uniref:restriction endonuclease subunit S n=1 Tax=Streptomyces sp. NPDC001812 TaxID=3364611 RepID=UPI0036C223C5
MAEQTVSLAELVAENQIEVGAGRPRSVNQDGDPLPILRVADVLDGKIGSSDFNSSLEINYRDLGPKVSRPGDIVLTVKGTVGRVALMPNRGPRFAYSPQLCYFRPRTDGRLAARYLYYWFRSADFWIQANALKGQTDMADFISLSDILSLKVRVPSRVQQDDAVAFLGALDDKIAANEQVRDTLLGLARAYYEAATTSRDPERIGDLALLFDGPHATPNKTESGPWFLSISSLKNGYLDLTESAHLSEEDFPRWTRRVQPQAGDVLFSYETRLGDAALMPPGIRGSLGRRMALLRSKSTAVSGALLLHAYLSPTFQEEVKRRTIHGATVDRLPLKEMPNWPVSLPAEGERERLSAKLDTMHARVTQTAQESRVLAALRDTLLPQLMSGKLRIRDAEKIVEDAV